MTTDSSEEMSLIYTVGERFVDMKQPFRFRAKLMKIPVYLLLSMRYCSRHAVRDLLMEPHALMVLCG